MLFSGAFEILLPGRCHQFGSKALTKILYRFERFLCRHGLDRVLPIGLLGTHSSWVANRIEYLSLSHRGKQDKTGPIFHGSFYRPNGRHLTKMQLPLWETQRHVIIILCLIIKRLDGVCPSNGSLFTKSCGEQLEDSFLVSAGLCN